MSFKDDLIKLGNDEPDLRDHIRPVLDRIDAVEKEASPRDNTELPLIEFEATVHVDPDVGISVSMDTIEEGLRKSYEKARIGRGFKSLDVLDFNDEIYIKGDLYIDENWLRRADEKLKADLRRIVDQNSYSRGRSAFVKDVVVESSEVSEESGGKKKDDRLGYPPPKRG